MTRIRIEQLVWDNWNIKHIKKHNVSVSETEEGIINVTAHKQGYNKRIMLIGRSGKRILAILVKAKLGQYYIVTARDAGKKERKLLYEKEKRQNT
ncbi:MAG: hypothetical protein Q7R43_01275 [Candidatus Daviesbacteria bacterium]|nr:hypothetical protein [Candidatus Daviesbacteria bacterium]